MSEARSSWRALRPLLLAGAATAAWLTFSTSPATADASTDSGPLLGGAMSSVSSPAVPLMQPTTPADQPIVAVPVVSSGIPEGTFTAAAIPVAEVADSGAADFIDTVVPPVAEALPVLEPVVQSVVALVDATVPSLSTTLTGLAVDGIAVAGEASAVAAAAPTATGAAPITDRAPSSLTDTFFGLPTLAGVPSTLAAASPEFHSAAPDYPWTGGPATPPAPTGPAPAAGSGASPSGSAAWLDGFALSVPDSGSLTVSGSPQHAPSPVSFDPGSSPD